MGVIMTQARPPQVPLTSRVEWDRRNATGSRKREDGASTFQRYHPRVGCLAKGTLPRVQIPFCHKLACYNLSTRRPRFRSALSFTQFLLRVNCGSKLPGKIANPEQIRETRRLQPGSTRWTASSPTKLAYARVSGWKEGGMALTRPAQG
jgi:hypothetical protein